MAETETIKLCALYPWTCPVCESEFEAAPSPSMTCGVNDSFDLCEVCGAHLHLAITPDLTGSAMAAEEYNVYCDRIQAAALFDRNSLAIREALIAQT